MATTIKLPRHIPELDGFRAIAVLMVMIEHMCNAWTLPPAAVSWMPHFAYFALTHGWLGVDLFFILSGFLITGILLDQREQPDYFASFYSRRALRILPVALVCISIWTIAYGHAYERYFVLALVFCANLDFLFGISTPQATGVLWSLAVEEHFYWIWPIIVRRSSLRVLGLIAITIVLLSPIVRGVATHYGTRWENVYQLSWFRFDGLAIGALLAIFVRGRFFTVRITWMLAIGWLSVVAIATVICKPFGVFEPHSSVGEALRFTQAQAVFAGAIAVALAHQGSAFFAFLRTWFARWTAQLSYCLYLIHLSIGDLYYWLLQHAGINDVALLGPRGALAMRYVVILPVSFALAALSQKILERPFLRMRNRAPSLRSRTVG